MDLATNYAPIGGDAQASQQNLDSFHTLVADLNKVLGPDAGINSEGVDPEELIGLMEKYVSTESEWKKYAFGDKSRAYTRNLVDKGNAQSNLVSGMGPGSRVPWLT